MRPCRTLGVNARRGFSRRVTQQRLPEQPVAHEVHVLLEMQQVGTDSLERVCDRVAEHRREHVADVRLRQILQAGRFRTLDELVEVERNVGLLEVLVIEVGVGTLASRSISRARSCPYAPPSSTADPRNASRARACSICSGMSSKRPA